MSSGSTDSSSSNVGLTLKNLMVHNNTQRHYNRWQSPDETSSVYSVDQEGFYTSMHTDSGLKKSRIDLIEEEDTINPIEPMCLHHQQKVKKKHRRKYESIMDNIGSGKKRVRKKSTSSIQLHPVTAHKDSTRTMDSSDFPTPPSPNENGDSGNRSLDRVGVCLSSFALPPQSDINYSSFPNDEFIFSESDAESIHTRVKVKSSISSATFPSLCFVGSDEEDSDLLDYKKSPIHKVIPSNSTSVSAEIGSSSFSTWPRSPRSYCTIDSSNTSFAHQKRSPSVPKFDSIKENNSHSFNNSTMSIVPETNESERKLKSKNSFRNFSDNSVLSGSHIENLSSNCTANVPVSDKSTDSYQRKRGLKAVYTNKAVEVSIPQLNLDNGTEIVNTTCTMSPCSAANQITAVPAQLIVTSPMANKVSFVENPMKRSICSRVSENEMISYGKCYNRNISEEPRPNEDDNLLLNSTKTTQPLKTSTFNVSNYGRSWYDDIHSATRSMDIVPSPINTNQDSLIHHRRRPIGFSNFLSDKYDSVYKSYIPQIHLPEQKLSPVISKPSNTFVSDTDLEPDVMIYEAINGGDKSTTNSQQKKNSSPISTKSTERQNVILQAQTSKKLISTDSHVNVTHLTSSQDLPMKYISTDNKLRATLSPVSEPDNTLVSDVDLQSDVIIQEAVNGSNENITNSQPPDNTPSSSVGNTPSSTVGNTPSLTVGNTPSTVNQRNESVINKTSFGLGYKSSASVITLCPKPNKISITNAAVTKSCSRVTLYDSIEALDNLSNDSSKNPIRPEQNMTQNNITQSLHSFDATCLPTAEQKSSKPSTTNLTRTASSGLSQRAEINRCTKMSFFGSNDSLLNEPSTDDRFASFKKPTEKNSVNTTMQTATSLPLTNHGNTAPLQRPCVISMVSHFQGKNQESITSPSSSITSSGLGSSVTNSPTSPLNTRELC